MSRYAGPARYEYFGKTIHLRFRSLTDLKHVLKLNEVFWLAITAPIGDFLLPGRFLELVDTDGDGRIRVEEVKNAIIWLQAHSKAEQPVKVLKRQHLKTDALRSKWDRIAQAFQLEEEAALKLAEIRELRSRFIEEPGAYGAGALAPEEVKSEEQASLLAAISQSVAPEKEAVTEEQLDRFLEDARLLLKWREASPGENEWADEYPVFRALAEPLQRYFELADVAEFTGRQPEMVWPEEALDEKLRELPLVWPLEATEISFASRVNPVHKEKVRAFVQKFLAPENPVLKRERYEELKERFETYSEWLEKAPESSLKPLSSEALERWLNDASLVSEVREKLQDKREKGLVQQDFHDFEKLLLYQAHLLEFCQNFVSFRDFYDPKARALFERGTLIMDGREFHLALPVDNIESHKTAAARSSIFVLYVEVEGEILAVPVTSGERGNLAIGKHGVFHHVDGKEKEALVVDLVVNPISLLEAIFAPFAKAGQAMRKRIEASSEEKEETLIQGTTTSSKPSGSMLAGGGVALAALGSSGAFILKTLASLTVPSVLLGLLFFLLICLTPIALVAYLKLRSRDFSAVLEGNEWGINARMRLTQIQARQFTQSPRHPGYVGSSMGVILVMGMIVVAGCFAYFFRDHILLLFGF